MTPPSLDAEFSRFQRTRAPEALAAVFDAAAPRLLLVAMHLCGEAAAAEDLVQTVFLQAMRDVDRFDPRRPVLPWLLGILEHRAQDQRERAHRRRERGGDALAGALESAVDVRFRPDRAAADAELLQTVGAALDRLPKHYHEVMTLRLVHGLRAVDIAHAQGVPPATVRTQLRRGLDLLRAALPRGLATPSLLVLLVGEALRARDGLPMVKRNLLRTLSGGSAAAAGAVLVKWVCGIVLAAALVVGVMWSMPTVPPVVRVGPGDGTANVVASQLGSGQAEPNTAAPHDAMEPSRELAGHVAATATTVLHGRVVALPTGLPVPDSRVQLRTYHASDRGDVPADWVDPLPVETDAEGRFSFSFAPPAALNFEVKVEAVGFVPDWRSFEGLRPGIEVDVGSISLEPGTPVRFHVEAKGRSCSGLEVRMERVAANGRPSRSTGSQSTDANGDAELGMCEPGVWNYEIATSLAGPRVGSLVVPLQATPFLHTVVLELPPARLTVSGTVLDTVGAPVAGLVLELPVNSWGYWPQTTAADGSFLFSMPAPPETNKTWHLRLPTGRTDLEWVESGGDFVWGTNDLHLVVRRRAPASLQVEVVDATTGAPVLAFGANCLADPWRGVGGSPDFSRRPLESRPDGLCEFRDLRPGPYRVSVFPPAPYADRADLPVELSEGQHVALRVALSPPAELLVEVVAAGTGAPMAGVLVLLAKVLPEDQLDSCDRSSYRSEILVRGDGGYSTGTNVLVLEQIATGADGLARVHAAPDTPALMVFAEAGHCLGAMARDVQLPAAGARLRLEVEPAAQLRGVVVPPAFVQRYGPSDKELAEAASKQAVQLPNPKQFAEDYPKVLLRRVGTAEEVGETYVDADGRFVLPSIPTGRYELWVEALVTYGRGGGGAWQAMGPLATVDVPATGSVPEVVLDAGRFVPGRATVRCFVDGEPWTGPAGFARYDEGSVTDVMANMGASGLATSPWLKPGRYVPFASVDRGNGDEKSVYGLEPFVVTAGGDVTVTAVLHRRAVVVTLRDGDGQPLPERRLMLQPIDHPEFHLVWRSGIRTDADGRVVFDPAPPGRLRIAAFAPTQDPSQDDIEPQVLLGELGATEDELAARWPR